MTATLWKSTFDVTLGNGVQFDTEDREITGLSNGNILVTYTFSPTGSGDVFGRLFNPNGDPITGEFQLNDLRTAGFQGAADVAPTNDGGFILAYTSGNNGVGEVVWERFDASGTAIDARIVATETASDRLFGSAEVVVNQLNNNAFVTWKDITDNGPTVTNSETDVLGRFVGGNGTVPGSAFTVSSGTSNGLGEFATALLTTGELVTVSEVFDGSEYTLGIRVQNSSGTVTHSNSTTLPDEVSFNPGFDVAALTNGRFVVTWRDGSDNIQARLFNSSAQSVGAQFTAEGGSDVALDARVLALPDSGGDFIVSWLDSTDGRVEFRQYTGSGTQVGTQVNASTDFGRYASGVSVDGRILFAGTTAPVGDIDAEIWDPRNSVSVSADDFLNTPLNFMSGDVVTGKPGRTEFDGNSRDNVFFGQASIDFAEGFQGDDTLDGGAGNDTLLGGVDNDKLEGRDGDDSLFGEDGNDDLDGRNDDDYLNGGFGNDDISGGNGVDTVDFGYSFPTSANTTAQSWFIRLDGQFGIGGIAERTVGTAVVETDRLVSVENVIGSGWNDTVDVRNQNDIMNMVDTRGGDDTVIFNALTSGTGSGDNDDRFFGGLGSDTAIFDGVLTRTSVFNLVAGELQTGTDTIQISSFENVQYSGEADVIGSSAANRIVVVETTGNDLRVEAGDGNDTIQSGVGDGVYLGEAGEDLFIDNLDAGLVALIGGQDDDTVDFSGASSGAVSTTIQGIRAIEPVVGTGRVSLQQIENLIGTSFADNINENAPNGDLIEVYLGLGNDTLTGTVNGLGNIFDGGGNIDTYIEDATLGRFFDLADELAGTTLNQALVSFLNFENVVGGSGDDTIKGDSLDNLFRGENGADLLEGAGGDDTLIGGLGDDTLDGGGDTDTADYSGHNDTISANIGSRVADAGTLGRDTLIDIENFIGGQRGDTVFGSEANNLIEGGFGGDLLAGLDGNDTLIGGDGRDSLAGGNNNDSLDGGLQHDRLFGNNGDDIIRGGAGDDTTNGGNGNDTIFGGDDDDNVLVGGGDDDEIWGGKGSDGINGSSGNDLLVGEDGDDRLFGAADNDTLLGGDHDDTLGGQRGNDTVSGQDGDDGLNGGGGNDLLDGGDDTDRLFGGTGSDTLNGGQGNDLLAGQAGLDVYVFEEEWGQDQISAYGFVATGADRQAETFDMQKLGIDFEQLSFEEVGTSTFIFLTDEGPDEHSIEVLFRSAEEVMAANFIF